MTRFARAEREALCDLLTDVGPDAPTLCEGWTTCDLAAHLVTRDRVRKAGVGQIIPRLHGITERAERATRDAHSYADLVRMVREGVSRWHPARFGVVDENINLVEFAIHHEDVRRAEPGWKARDVPGEEQDALWARLGVFARLGLRRATVGVVAERTDEPGRRTVRRGEPVVTIRGTALDLVLYVFGRGEASGVEFLGDQGAVAALRAARIGP